MAETAAQIDRADYGVDLFHGKYIGKFSANFGGFDEFCWCCFDSVVEHQIVEKTFDAAQFTGLGSLLDTCIVEVGQKRFDLVGCYLFGLCDAESVFHIIGNTCQIMQVGLHGIFGEFFLQ